MVEMAATVVAAAPQVGHVGLAATVAFLVALADAAGAGVGLATGVATALEKEMVAVIPEEAVRRALAVSSAESEG